MGRGGQHPVRRTPACPQAPAPCLCSLFAPRFVRGVVAFGASEAPFPLITFVAGDVERIVDLSMPFNPVDVLVVMASHATSAVAALPLVNTPVFELRFTPLL